MTSGTYTERNNTMDLSVIPENDILPHSENPGMCTTCTPRIVKIRRWRLVGPVVGTVTVHTAHDGRK